MAEPEKYLMQRRDFLRAASGGALAVTAGGLMSSLAGCGGGSGSSVLSAGGGATAVGGSGLIATQIATGTVNTAHIGGQRHSVVSAHQASAAVSAQGNFTTTVSAEGAQLLSVRDGSGGVRALGVSIPRGGTLTFDAASTALALVMMTPGILTIDPAEAAVRAAEIKGQKSFGPLVSFLTARLQTGPLDSLRGNATLETLKGAAIDEWMNRYKPLIVAGDGGAVPRTVTPNSINSQCSATWLDSANNVQQTGSVAQVHLSNVGWRFVRVDRLALDKTGKAISQQIPAIGPGPLVHGVSSGPGTPLAAMGGVTAASWGAIFVPASQGATTTTNAVTLNTPPGLVSLDYYVSGLGHGPGSDVPPFNNNYGEAAIKSVLFYIVFPLIDFGLGATTMLKKGLDFVSIVYPFTTPMYASVKSLQLNMQYGQYAQAAAALVDCALTLPLILPAVLAAAGVSIPAATVAGLALGVTGLAFSALNIKHAVQYWTLRPAAAKLDLIVSTVGVTVQ